jgi:hypothetical protein
MMISNSFYRKAAILSAAFFILIAPSLEAKQPLESLESIKKKAATLISQQKKSEAIQLVSEHNKTINLTDSSSEAAEFLVKISQTFISKEAQEAYEASINATLENAKEAKRQNDHCLQLEPQNADCLVQKIRLDYRDKNKAEVEKTWTLLADISKGSKLYTWVDLFIHKDDPSFAFKSKSFVKKINEKPTEDFFMLVLLETERAFLVKNFSRAKECIEYLEKNFPEFPETMYFKQKIDSESIEDKQTNANDVNLIYATKCKSLTKSSARKFRYDFDLCQRGAP